MKQDLMHTTKKNAFTLMEMLIVVAIIAALVAITIPVMSASLKKAKTAACQSNRRALLALLEVTYMTDGEDAVETVFQKNKDQYACPSDGVITYELDRDTGAITVNCSVHTEENTVWTQDKIDQLMAVMAGKSNHIDSCCLDTSSNAEKVRTELQAQGLNLKTLGATSWKYEVKNGKKYLFWTDYNIAVLPAGTKIPVIQYNASSGNYSVWTMSVNSYTDPTYGKYNVINITGTPYSPSTSTSANGNQTLAKAQEYYKQLKSSMK